MLIRCLPPPAPPRPPPSSSPRQPSLLRIWTHTLNTNSHFTNQGSKKDTSMRKEHKWAESHVLTVSCDRRGYRLSVFLWSIFFMCLLMLQCEIPSAASTLVLWMTFSNDTPLFTSVIILLRVSHHIHNKKNRDLQMLFQIEYIELPPSPRPWQLVQLYLLQIHTLPTHLRFTYLHLRKQ
jgi:hypothetical protein